MKILSQSKNRTESLLSLGMLSVLVISAGCSHEILENGSITHTPPATKVSNCIQAPDGGCITELKGTAWSGVRIAGDTIPSEIDITLTFGVDGRISGSAGCNRYFADYVQNENVLKLDSIGATMKMCPELNKVAERRYLAALETANGWGVKDNQLYLFGTGAELTFEKQD